ncbi:hypothetical protein EBQ90_06110 [bacterium]|nr:hypothetical protein [bacterium]
MKQWGLIVCVVSLVSLACPPEAIEARLPQTQSTECQTQWGASKLKVIVERDCAPCQLLIDQLKSIHSSGTNQAIEFIWLETESNRCLELSLKVASIGRSVCSTKEEVEKKWGVNSTPTLYWLEGSQRKVQRGLPLPLVFHPGKSR